MFYNSWIVVPQDVGAALAVVGTLTPETTKRLSSVSALARACCILGDEPILCIRPAGLCLVHEASALVSLLHFRRILHFVLGQLRRAFLNTSRIARDEKKSQKNQTHDSRHQKAARNVN